MQVEMIPMEVELEWWVPTATLLLGLAIGYLSHLILTRRDLMSADNQARRTIMSADREVEVILKEATVEAKNEVIKAREHFESTTKDAREKLLGLEGRISKREINLDRKVSMLEKKEATIDQRLAELEQEKTLLEQKEVEINQRIEAGEESLQRIADLSRDEARDAIMKRMEEELTHEAGSIIRKVQEEAHQNAEREARKIITLAIERYSSDQVNDVTASTVTLPNDEMKGRIIGKEGRNIRAIEAATGVNILIDETPETVVISGFDPMRREIARLSLERLITDGRIHPAHIEEIVAKVQEDVDETIRQSGEEAIYELGLQHVDPELVRTVGRLKYRHSYGQNILKHSLEMAHLMGSMAGELGLDVSMAKRIGLLHDIGKALDHKIEGSHAIIGADLLKRNGEQPLIFNAVAAHHREVEPESMYAVLTMAADAITAARPGARSGTTEIYLKRLEKLEKIANSFRGVDKSYAIQAGREVRVLVEPTKIDDNEAMQMARNISKQIESELQYPGQIKVTVVRETRCIEYAK